MIRAYHLDNAAADAEFLKGITVTGKVVIKDEAEDDIRKGDVLVIILTTGKKFKGRVVDVRLFSIDPYRVGELDIIRF